MPALVTNNAVGTLASSMNDSTTTLVLAGGQGTLFPAITDASQYFYVTVVDNSNNKEIMKCTGRATDTLTVVRAQDNTAARAFDASCRVELRPVAALHNNYAQKDSPNTFTGNQTIAGLADVSGTIVGASFITTGTSAAFAVTTGLSATIADGTELTVVPHTTNAEGCTLSVDGSSNYPVRGATGKSLLTGVMIAGTPYRMRFIGATSEWLLMGYTDSPYMIPLGGFLDFAGAAAPNSYFALPFGQAVSRATYAALFNLIGTAFGAGNGSTTFNLPDVRGRAVIGLDNMGGVAAGRVTAAVSGIDGATLGAAGGDQKMTLVRSDLPNVQPTFTGVPVAGHRHNAATADRPAPNYADLNPGTAINRFGLGGGSTVAYQLQGSYAEPDRGYTSLEGAHTPAGTVQSLNGGVAQTNTKNVQPSIVLSKILRVI